MWDDSCKKGHIKIEGTNLKPSKEIFGNEEITIRKNQINYKIKVIDIPPNRVGAKLVDLYRKDLTPKEEFEKTELLKYSKTIIVKKEQDVLQKKIAVILTIIMTILIKMMLICNPKLS